MPVLSPMFPARSIPSRVVGWALCLTLVTPGALAQAPAPPAPSAPPATSPAPSAPASTPAPTPPSVAPADQKPFAKPLAETLTGMARAEYEAGRLLYMDGDYAGASLKFQLAYEQSQDPRLLWNMAAAEKNLRRYARVVELVERYVAESGSRLMPEDRAEADALLATVRAFISSVTLEVQPEGSSVFIDDVEVGKSPLAAPVLVDMGEHRLRVSKQGFQDFTTTQALQGGAPFSLAVSLQPIVHQGRLHVVAGPGESISVDGKAVGSGQWEGVIPSGIHRVTVTAAGKRPYQSDVVVQDDQTQSLRISLEAEAPPPKDKANLTWLWVAGGTVLAAGLGVGAYFAFQPDDKPPVKGTLGTVELPVLGRF